MDSKSVFLLITIVFSLFACSSSKNLPENSAEVTRKVQSKDFTIKVNYALPTRGSQIYLTSNYDLRIKNDSAFAYLPYYGVAYVAPYNSSDGGIKFSEPMYDYVLTENKKKDGWKVTFKVKTTIYEVNVYLDIYKNGSSFLTVHSFERESISFSGEMKLD